MPFRDTPEPYLVPEPRRPSQVVLIPGESPEEYASLRELWTTEYCADENDPFELEIVERIIEADFRRHRLLRRFNQLESHLFSTVGDFASWTDKEFKLYTQVQRLYAAALREVETLRRQINQQKLSRYRQICVEFQASVVIAKRRQFDRQAAEEAARKNAPPRRRSGWD